ncbi:MAG: DUF3307 domain-containing protein [Bacteroidales bacterium]|nr:DUF3307 domain-containing protein [Bacteroidales bacterium]
MEILFKLVICHLIGDFLFQSRYIAETKGTNWYHLFVHCMLYAIPFYFCFGWCWQLAVITILHFPIDAAKARYGKLSYFWDQVLHYLLFLLYFI